MPANYSNCSGCPYCNQTHLKGTSYYSNANSPLSIDMGNNADTLLIFQAPGADEWAGGTNTSSGNRIPIDSKNTRSTAERMRKSMNRKGVNRSDYDITEAVQCFPGRGISGRDKKPNAKSQKYCLAHLVNDLSQKKYRKIIAFGQVAHENALAAVNAVNAMGNISQPQPTPAPHPSSGVSDTTLNSSY